MPPQENEIDSKNLVTITDKDVLKNFRTNPDVISQNPEFLFAVLQTLRNLAGLAMPLGGSIKFTGLMRTMQGTVEGKVKAPEERERVLAAIKKLLGPLFLEFSEPFAWIKTAKVLEAVQNSIDVMISMFLNNIDTIVGSNENAQEPLEPLSSASSNQNYGEFPIETVPAISPRGLSGIDSDPIIKTKVEIPVQATLEVLLNADLTGRPGSLKTPTGENISFQKLVGFTFIEGGFRPQWVINNKKRPGRRKKTQITTGPKETSFPPQIQILKRENQEGLEVEIFDAKKQELIFTLYLGEKEGAVPAQDAQPTQPFQGNMNTKSFPLAILFTSNGGNSTSSGSPSFGRSQQYLKQEKPLGERFKPGQAFHLSGLPHYLCRSGRIFQVILPDGQRQVVQFKKILPHTQGQTIFCIDILGKPNGGESEEWGVVISEQEITLEGLAPEASRVLQHNEANPHAIFISSPGKNDMSLFISEHIPPDLARRPQSEVFASFFSSENNAFRTA